MMKKPSCALSVTLFAAGLLAIAQAQAEAAENVKIGVIYPLTGNAASAGQSAKDAVNLGVEIVNTAQPPGYPTSAAPRSSSMRPTIKAIRRSVSSRPCG
jgi:ABC-type sugar transport system substrate-binding protein